MKLSELKITQDLKSTEYSGAVANILRTHGWTVLGTGVEAAVATRDDRPYVLKIYNNYSKYNQFVEFVQQHPSVYLPQFSRFVKKIPGTNWNYVRMEKLESVSEGTLREKYMPMLICLLKAERDARMSPSNMGYYVERWLVNNHIPDIHKQGLSILDDDQQLNDICAQAGFVPSDSWKHTVTGLCKTAQTLGINHMDLHASNFMRRGSVLVITDPFF